MDKRLSEHMVEAVSFSVSDSTHYVFSTSDHTYGFNVPEDEEVICNALDASAPARIQEARRKERIETKLRRQLRDVVALRAQLEQKLWQATLAEQYYMWKTKVDSTLSTSAPPLETFPQLPQAVCKYSRDWLRKERLRWHPDQVAKNCNDTARNVLIKQATAMYALFEVLIAKEGPSVRPE
ncbi:hypothetical protein PG997_007379 [Apiospora hydei]|uniref:J domain-containing protein n=1 Tax=Apiospora hydei TaxID=1337664 RepID=A0ABR1W7U6_9PEZI